MITQEQVNDAIQSLKQAISLKPDEFKEKAKDYKAFDSINSPYYKACFYALIDNTEEALKELQNAVEKNQNYKQKAKNESAFDSIRDNEEFKKLIE